jgi:hypothetical protein
MFRSTANSLFVAGVTSLALATSSCALGIPALVEGVQSEPNPTVSTQSYDPMDSASPSESEPEPSDSESAPEDTEYRFGQTTVYENGLEVTLSKLKTFKPSEYSSFGDEDKYVYFTVTIKNGTGKRYDPSEFYTTATTGDDESEQVFDTDNGFNSAPTTKVRAGKTIKFKIGYGVNNKTDFVVEVTPGVTDDYNSVLFVGAVK